MHTNWQSPLEGLIKQNRRIFQLPAISVSVSYNKQAFHTALGLSNIENNIKASTQSIYAIGSSTKAFISLAINILAHEGKIDLDTPVQTYLPSFQMADKYAAKHLTMRDALSHRSGLPRHDLAWLNTPDRSLEEQIASLAFLPSAWPIRYRLYYQNHMFMLATWLVETITQMPWGTFVTERIFAPLQMTNSYIFGDEVDMSNPLKAAPYINLNDTTTLIPYNYAKAVGGAGTIYSSTEDMTKWLDFQINGNDSIVPLDILRDMQSPQMVIKKGEMFSIMFPEIEMPSYGLGWFIESYRGVKIVHHGGSIDGFKSEQIFVPDWGISISLLCNLNETPALTALGYSLLDSLLQLAYIDWDLRYKEASEKLAHSPDKQIKTALLEAPTVSIPSESLDDFVGVYDNKGYGRLTVSLHHQGLMLDIIKLRLPLIPTGKDTFLLQIKSHQMHFPVSCKRNDNGHIETLLIPLESQQKEPIVFRKQ